MRIAVKALQENANSMDHSSGLKIGLFLAEPVSPYLITSLCECWSCELEISRVSILALFPTFEKEEGKVLTLACFHE